MRNSGKYTVWQNAEDEVLKAAVMKYGVNNWSRISSMMPYKSPKQCKARWVEYLDPSVNHTPFTAEEDEMVLKLAKRLPNQWRTIAQSLRRTAVQCLIRYEELIQLALSANNKVDSIALAQNKATILAMHSESEKAKDDPVTFELDEREMLCEVRARIANTRGKKAKRKAREAAIEAVRRSMLLRRDDDLKGLDHVPFQHKPVAIRGQFPLEEMALQERTDETSASKIEARLNAEVGVTTTAKVREKRVVSRADGDSVARAKRRENLPQALRTIFGTSNAIDLEELELPVYSDLDLSRINKNSANKAASMDPVLAPFYKDNNNNSNLKKFQQSNKLSTGVLESGETLEQREQIYNLARSVAEFCNPESNKLEIEYNDDKEDNIIEEINEPEKVEVSDITALLAALPKAEDKYEIEILNEESETQPIIKPTSNPKSELRSLVAQTMGRLPQINNENSISLNSAPAEVELTDMCARKIYDELRSLVKVEVKGVSSSSYQVPSITSLNIARQAIQKEVSTLEKREIKPRKRMAKKSDGSITTWDDLSFEEKESIASESVKAHERVIDACSIQILPVHKIAEFRSEGLTRKVQLLKNKIKSAYREAAETKRQTRNMIKNSEIAHNLASNRTNGLQKELDSLRILYDKIHLKRLQWEKTETRVLDCKKSFVQA